MSPLTSVTALLSFLELLGFVSSKSLLMSLLVLVLVFSARPCWADAIARDSVGVGSETPVRGSDGSSDQADCLSPRSIRWEFPS